LFSNSTKLNCLNAVTLLSSHKANPAVHHFLIQFQSRVHFKWLLHATGSANTQNATHRENTLNVSLWCRGTYKILRNRSQQAVNSRLLFPEWGGICRSHISRRVLDFSEVLIQLLNHQIIPLFFSQELEAKLCSHCCATAGLHNTAVWFAPDFSFSFLIVLVLVRFACCNFYFYIVFVFSNCYSSRFRTHWTKCNSSSFRFRYENSSG